MRLNSKIKSDLKNYLVNKMKDDKEKVIVYSSVQLSNENIKMLKINLPDISLQNALYRVDESLLAGVVIKIGSKIIDCSLKGTLSNLKHIVYEAR